MVDWPGEKLTIKLVEVFQQGVGSLFRPWQIKREANARLEAREEGIVRIAQTEAIAEDIRLGRKALISGKVLSLPLPDDCGEKSGAGSGEDGVLELVNAAKLEADYLSIKRAINLRRIELQAHNEAEGTPNEDVSDEPINPDWFARWREAAQDVSDEEMQQLWARLLTGETTSPGTYSLQTVSLLRNLSKQQAEWIAALGSFSLTGWMYKDCGELLAKKGLTLDVLLELEGLSVLGALDSVGGLVHRVPMEPFNEKEVAGVIRGGLVGLVIRHDTPAPTLDIPMYKIMKVGQELISLGKFEVDQEYLHKIAEFARKKGFKTSLAQFVLLPDKPSRIGINSEVPILEPEEDTPGPSPDT